MCEQCVIYRTNAQKVSFLFVKSVQHYCDHLDCICRLLMFVRVSCSHRLFVCHRKREERGAFNTCLVSDQFVLTLSVEKCYCCNGCPACHLWLWLLLHLDDHPTEECECCRWNALKLFRALITFHCFGSCFCQIILPNVVSVVFACSHLSSSCANHPFHHCFIASSLRRQTKSYFLMQGICSLRQTRGESSKKVSTLLMFIIKNKQNSF